MNRSVHTDKLYAGRQTVVFLSATLLLSAPWWVLLAKYKMQGHWALVLGLMCSPGLAGLVTALVCRVPMRRFGWRWPKWKWIAAGYFIPIGYSLVAYGFIWITGLGTPHEAFIRGPGQPTGWGLIWWVHILTYIPLSTLPIVLGVFGGGTLGALGEEIGWSGFLVPALARRFNFAATSLMSGAIWAVWHAISSIRWVPWGCTPLVQLPMFCNHGHSHEVSMGLGKTTFREPLALRLVACNS
jgi:membrane protease YdiL (CAAX protease family)